MKSEAYFVKLPLGSFNPYDAAIDQNTDGTSMYDPETDNVKWIDHKNKTEGNEPIFKDMKLLEYIQSKIPVKLKTDKNNDAPEVDVFIPSRSMEFYISYKYSAFVYASIARRMAYLGLNYDLLGSMNHVLRFTNDADYALFSFYFSEYIKF